MINAVNEAINRKLASMSFTSVVNGLIESIEPLKIRINDRIIIGLEFIEPKSLGISDNSPNPAFPFVIGDKINLISYNNGQRFYVLGTTGGGERGASFRLRGTWDISTEYYNSEDYIDVIDYNGSSYGCLVTNTGNIPSSSSIYWVLLASKGETGETGPTGPQGIQGIQGEPGQDGNAVYFIPYNEGTAINPVIISEKPIGTYYFLDSIGQPTGKTTAYFKRTPTSTQFSATWMTNLNIIESNIDTITDENVVVGTYETADGARRALLTQNSNSGFKISVFFNAIVSTNSAQSVSGVKTFTNLPKSSVAPTEIEHLVNKEYVDGQVSSMMNLIYPIGSIYMSVNNINPSTLFGGTWVEWGAGKVPVGVDASDTDFDTVEKTGGHKDTQKHTHIQNQHRHRVSTRTSTYASGVQSAWRCITAPASTNGDYNQNSYSEYATPTNQDYGTGDSGNLQPYITCYMWKRTE